MLLFHCLLDAEVGEADEVEKHSPLQVSLRKSLPLIFNCMAWLCKLVEMSLVLGVGINRGQNREPLLHRDKLVGWCKAKLKASVVEAFSSQQMLTKELHQLEITCNWQSSPNLDADFDTRAEVFFLSLKLVKEELLQRRNHRCM